MQGQVGVEVTGFGSDLPPQPSRTRKRAGLIGQLDFSNNQSCIVCGKFVDFPPVLAGRNDMPRLLNHTIIAKAEKSGSVSERNLIFELGTG